MRTELLIVDFSNTLIRSLAVNSNLSYNGQVTGGLYGVVSQLVLKLKTYHPSHVIFCKDYGPYLRTQKYPEYKADRKKTVKPDWYQWIGVNGNLLTEFLNLVKVPVWAVQGLEADDLIAALARRHAEDFKQIIILSNDDDLYQLLDITNHGQHNVVLARKSGDQTYSSFKQQYPSLEPKDWITLTAMTGTHNNITGINRCGIATAYKWIKEFKQTGKENVKVTENKQLIELNKSLIRLPFPDTEIPEFELTEPHFEQRSIMRFLAKYGITYTNSMNHAFDYYSIGNPFGL